MKGYHIVEFEELDKIITSKVSIEFQILVLRWIVSQLNEKIVNDALSIEIDLIKIQYVSAYPGLGVHYLETPTDDFGDFCEKYLKEHVKQILKTSSFIGFAVDNFESFQEEIKQWEDMKE